ncbi:MAG: inorganic diphosphatase, partial [Bacteroidales bacterium]|nr:inorganic diphosphatase [Bacteroidales bacterium]
MKKIAFVSLLISIIVSFVSCNCNDCHTPESISQDTINNQSLYVLANEKHFLKDYKPYADNGYINAVIEIPAGTLEKWEVDKIEGNMKLEFVDEKPRIVQYLAYPANYGMIPQTLLPKELGGDGDPLDVLVLGDACERGEVVACKLIGVMIMLDRGEQDDKLIAVKYGSPYNDVNSIAELDEKFPGITEILKIWFTNYKGGEKIEVVGFEEKEVADEILIKAIEEYKKATSFATG